MLMPWERTLETSRPSLMDTVRGILRQRLQRCRQQLRPVSASPAGEDPTSKLLAPEDSPANKPRLLTVDEAPEHMRFNPYIRTGYRDVLSPAACIESAFWWTNETINIWSHVFGWMLLGGLGARVLVGYRDIIPPSQLVVFIGVIVCAQITMALSTLYHVFVCASQRCHELFLTLDMLGIIISLLSMFLSGVQYAFWCHEWWRHFYTATVALMLGVALVAQLPWLGVPLLVRQGVLLAWAGYGMVPTVHLAAMHGGWASPVVKIFLPRILELYAIGGTAFLIYCTKIPERWFPGRLDVVGSSHQIWHALVVLALYHWYNTGALYVVFRMTHGCPAYTGML
ncbi:progestin and adipoQ receptor family member 3-like [Schistocerca piceifrons]|uniref:progestin and adipoQ receptor family member 3-like n=1 Tax=Schistocerca piceifrons TaxID=274613 RepID=UPI001F5ED747|nr:progestin and adipoQ receptor family member 3-like [Schistocerca piceifrons]